MIVWMAACFMQGNTVVCCCWHPAERYRHHALVLHTCSMHTGQNAGSCCTECSRAASPTARPALLRHALQQSLALLHAIPHCRDLLLAVHSTSTAAHSNARHCALQQDLLSQVLEM